jgi:hypothetical protein
MTAEEELRSLLQWAEQMQLENVAAALRRVLIKLSRKGSISLLLLPINACGVLGLCAAAPACYQ